jgi:hypothetical protein
MSMVQTTADPKFVPAAASLKVVDMKVSDIRTDADLVAFVGTLHETEALTQARYAVAVFTARKRGWEFADLCAKFKVETTKAKELEKEGMAILRLQEITRTVRAIRTGDLGYKVIDEITSKPLTLTEDDVDQRIIDLELLGSGKAISKKYVLAGGKAMSDDQVAAVVQQAITQVGKNVEPLNAATIVKAVTAFSEEVGLEVKKEPRKPGEQKTGPMGLEFHLKAALKDVAALEKAAEEPYVLTTHDYKALFDLVSFFGLSLEPTEEMVKALDVAEKAGL